MRKFLIFFLCLIFSSVYLITSLPVKSANAQTLTIKEIMPDPVGDDSLYEWIELQNNSTQSLQLNLYKINGTKLPTATILSQEIFILARNTSYLYSRYTDLTNNAYVFSASLANSGGTLNLTDNADNIIQSFNYGQSQEGKSYELLEGTCGQISINTTAVGNTIGKLNTQCSSITPTSSTSPTTSPAVTVSLSKYSNLLEISQVRPCGNIGSVIISSNDTYDIDLTKWQIDADDVRTMYLADMAISSKSNIIITMPAKFLLNSGGRISLMDPSGNQKDVFKYPKCSSANDYFEITSGDYTEVNKNETTDVTKEGSDLKYPKIYNKAE